jgi:RNA polymerase sigma-70 factor (ECF subfamily)
MTAIGEQSLRWLVAAKVERDVDLTSLVGTYSGVLYRVAYSVLRNGAEAEDVVQDVFVRVLRQPGRLDEVVEVRAWLVKIAWNLSLDRRRRQRPEQMEEGFLEGLVAGELGAEAALAGRQRVGAVLREMDRLPKGEREVLLLSAVEELGTAEIGQVVGRSESAVRALLFRARTRLRERLERGGA